jgi:Mrp family chromosome partitioning ATPase
MITLSLLIEAARRKYQLEIRYVHPTLFVFCVSDEFRDLAPDERLIRFAEKTGVPAADAQAAANAASANLLLLTSEERRDEYGFVDESSSPNHWLPLFDSDVFDGLGKSQEVGASRAIHFFGFKGGQGRSTSLGMLAKSLADDGYRVLAVDADIEAPSLDVLFNVKADSPESTLMGLCGWAPGVAPLSAYVSQKAGGRVDLLACRPANPAYDMDFAAFALRTALDTSLLSSAATRLQKLVSGDSQAKYDFVLFDHRTGISTSVLPILSGWPGSVVIAVRLDGLSDQVTQLYRILFATYQPNPGAFVSFSLDPEDTRAALISRKGATIERLLGTLAEAIASGAEDKGEDLSPDLLQSYWVTWFHDRGLLSSPLPQIDEISKDNQDSIQSWCYRHSRRSFLRAALRMLDGSSRRVKLHVYFS